MNPAKLVAMCCLRESLFAQEEGEGPASFEEIAAEFRAYVKKTFQYNLCEWEPASQYAPRYMLLGGDRGILAYVALRYAQGSQFKSRDLAMPLKDAIKMVSHAESRLDRPIFFLYLLDYDDRTCLYFETSEQIKDRLFRDRSCANEKENRYYPDVSLMGGFANLKRIWDELKGIRA